MSVREIPEILYAPQKAFKKIIQNPRYVGAIVIMVLFVLAYVGCYYAFLSRVYYDNQTAPQLSEQDKDTWTEATTLWSSNASIIANTTDYVNGTYYGSKSIQFSLTNGSQVWMQLNISSPLDCTSSGDFHNLSFRLKLIEPLIGPSNVSIYLFSGDPQNNFYQSLTDKANETGLWNNMTISLGAGWTPSNANADWSSITGAKLEFTWSTDSNITVLVDDLFFHGKYKSAVELNGVGILLNFSINAVMQFTIQWVVLGVFLYIIPKIFKAAPVWRPTLIIAGFALVTLFIQYIIFAAIPFIYPETRISLKSLGGVEGESVNAWNFEVQAGNSVFVMWSYIERIFYVWTIALCAIAMRILLAVPWMKSIFISALAYLFSLLIFRFLTYGAVWL